MKLYKEEIIDHYKNPRRFGELSNKTHEASETNASCGDMMEVYLFIKDGIIEDAAFKGVGCALSTAAASMLMENLVGKKQEDVKKWDGEKIEELIGEVNPGRQKCVMLPLEAVREAVK
jgi:SUF system NifU family Fe-S assembly protein